jgi:hypothetical protein
MGGVEDGVVLLSWTLKRLEALGWTRFSGEATDADSQLRRAQETLGEVRFSELLAEGPGLTQEAAIRRARAAAVALDALSSSPVPDRVAAAPRQPR